MRSETEAHAIAETHVAAMPLPDGDRVELLSESTLEFSEGWVFFYQSAKARLTGFASDQLAGNAPIFVPKSSELAAVFLPTSRPVREALDAYLISGDPHGRPIEAVQLLGWAKGASAVSAIAAVRDASRLGLAESKAIVERCLAGEQPIFTARSLLHANEAVSQLERLQFMARVPYGV